MGESGRGAWAGGMVGETRLGVNLNRGGGRRALGP